MKNFNKEELFDEMNVIVTTGEQFAGLLDKFNDENQKYSDEIDTLVEEDERFQKLNERMEKLTERLEDYV